MLPCVLVDTDEIINYSHSYPSDLSIYFNLQAKKKLSLAVSTITIYEFYSDTNLKNEESVKLVDFLFSKFEIWEVTHEIAKIAAKSNRQNGLFKKMSAADILIAATAIYHRVPLLTCNKKHFKAIPGLKFA